MKINEMRESRVLDYYRLGRLLDIHVLAKRMCRWHPDIKEYPETQQILSLVKKYHELTGKIKEYEVQDSNIYP